MMLINVFSSTPDGRFFAHFLVEEAAGREALGRFELEEVWSTSIWFVFNVRMKGGMPVQTSFGRIDLEPLTSSQLVHSESAVTLAVPDSALEFLLPVPLQESAPSETKMEHW